MHELLAGPDLDAVMFRAEDRAPEVREQVTASTRGDVRHGILYARRYVNGSRGPLPTDGPGHVRLTQVAAPPILITSRNLDVAAREKGVRRMSPDGR